MRTNPGAVTPESKRNEALGLIRGGLQDVSATRTSLDWGVQVPWDPNHVFYVWYDALINYATAVGYGEDEARFETWWPVVHHLIGKDILRFHCVYWPALCMAAGIDPPHRISRPRVPAGGRGKNVQDGLQPDSPRPTWCPRSASTASVTTSCGTSSSAPMASSPTRAWSPAITPTWPTTWATFWPGSAPSSSKSAAASARRPGPTARLAELAAEVYEAAADAWARVAPSEALDATWRLVRAANAALEAAEPWRAEPGPAVDAVLGDALEVLRIVAVLASPALTRAPVEIWRRIGLAGCRRGQRLPDAAKWGGYPGGLPVETGAPPCSRV